MQESIFMHAPLEADIPLCSPGPAWPRGKGCRVPEFMSEFLDARVAAEAKVAAATAQTAASGRELAMCMLVVGGKGSPSR